VIEVFRFGRFRFDADRLELLADGTPLKVEPRPLAVLAELLRHAGELVTKTELMDSVWTGRVVSESVITRCINRLRLALDDETQTLILTVHGFGYRFTGRVVRDSLQEEAAPVGVAGGGLRAGEVVPLRPGWQLERPLDGGRIWLAHHETTAERRVFKFGFEPLDLAALRREVFIYRVLHVGLSARPDFVRLLDQNLTAAPFFIEVEYCPEGNLADWLEARGGAAAVPLAQRLDLVAQAAEALAAAHSLGVLHLDIKPANLLVWTDTDGRARIRWADFGSGRLVEPRRLAELGITQADLSRTIVEGAQHLQGTLNYLAPEVLRGETPTSAADIYALGVMLYQVIIGDLRRPIAAGWESNVPDELLREDVAAAAHDTPQSRLSSATELAGRLRSLEDRRTQAELAARRSREQQTMQRRLERVQARRPWLIATFLALLIGLGFSVRNYRTAVRARDSARVQASVADAVVTFLDHDILSEGSPFSVADGSGGRQTVRDAVDRAAAKLGGRFPGQPRIEAAIRATIGQVYVEDGDYAAAETQIRRAVALDRAAGTLDDRTIQAEYRLAFALTVDRRYTDALGLLKQANRQLAAMPGARRETRLISDVINGNYWLLRQAYRTAIPFFQRALAEAPPGGTAHLSHTVIRQTSLAWCYAATGQFNQARPLYAAALRAVHRAEPAPGALTGMVEERYGIGLFLAGHTHAARPMLEAAYAHLEKAIGNDGLTAEALTYLGWLNLREGSASLALSQLRTAYQEEVASAGADHPMTLRARACLGLAELATGSVTDGLTDLQAAVIAYRQVLGADAPEAQVFLYDWVKAALRAGKSAPIELAAVRALSVTELAQAAPWADWNRRLTTLDALLAARG
jgi:non-specific serine/threonine protein kinase